MSTLNSISLKYHDLEQKAYYVTLNHETVNTVNFYICAPVFI